MVELALLAGDRGHRAVHHRDVGSGITQGLMWRAYDSLGFLQYSFIEPWKRCIRST